jgi:chromosome segregation ATPase
MRLAHLDLCGFRGYNKPLRIDFGDRFTIIDGRNGVGKSTIFDAVEFALTGTIAKYEEKTASGETVADYIWWTGVGSPPVSRYVEVGFRDANGSVHTLRRGEFNEPDESVIRGLTDLLCDPRLAPASPLVQLCQSAIIRDEQITELSMDLKEADRYALLRSALGASDAEAWIQRASRLASATKKRVVAAQQEVTAATSEMAASARRLDEVRARLVSEEIVAESAARLRLFANTSAPIENLSGPVRETIASLMAEVESLRELVRAFEIASDARSSLTQLQEAVQAARDRLEKIQTESVGTAVQIPHEPAVAGAWEASQLASLIQVGRKLGLKDGHCPLCMADRSQEEFDEGLRTAEEIARRLNDDAMRYAELEQTRSDRQEKIEAAQLALNEAEAARLKTLDRIEGYEQQLRKVGFPSDLSRQQLTERVAQLLERLTGAQKDLRVLDTLRMRDDIDRAVHLESDARSRLARLQERLSRALKADALAQALHDAARRAASETLDLRLERVLPLMSELYRRLRPHPVWNDIEYSIRGDVRRFLKLQVGENLNPEFLFSSGQRRATGLAFLLSINLSLAWSWWQTILMDDPVQHIDDFRTVHLAEVVAQLVSQGRQVVCAVEDAALADLFCRRVPIAEVGSAKRITLGPDTEGSIIKVEEQLLQPMIENAIVMKAQRLAAG